MLAGQAGRNAHAFEQLAVRLVRCAAGMMHRPKIEQVLWEKTEDGRNENFINLSYLSS